MEAASKRLGRPRGPSDESPLAFTEGFSRRSRQNAHYTMIAWSALEEEAEFEWVTGSTGETPFKTKPGILSELGRLLCVGGVLAAQNAARHICETRPTTKRAIAIVREARLRRAPQGTAEGAEAAIIKAMNNYRDTHPNTTLVQLREALNEAYSIVENMIDEKGSQ